MPNLIIQQGTTSGISLPIRDANNQPVDMTGWTGVGQIRAFRTNKLLYTFSTANGTLILANSLVTFTWTASVTSAWKWDQAMIGIELVNANGRPMRFIQDIIKLSKEVVV